MLESDPPRRLSLRWRNAFKTELKDEGRRACTIEIEMAALHGPGQAHRRTTTSSGAARCSRNQRGLARVLSSLKSYWNPGAGLPAHVERGRRDEERHDRSGQFTPKTVYVTYIAAPPDKVWQALTTPDFTRKYFWDRAVEIEPKLGGAFVLRLPDGRVNVRAGRRLGSPPRKLSLTWQVVAGGFRKLPECLVTYDIARAGEAVDSR